VRHGAVDGFNVTPYLIPDGLDDIVDLLVPELQERGVYRTAYTGTTLREPNTWACVNPSPTEPRTTARGRADPGRSSRDSEGKGPPDQGGAPHAACRMPHAVGRGLRAVRANTGP
jgi:hypothetical protein